MSGTVRVLQNSGVIYNNSNNSGNTVNSNNKEYNGCTISVSDGKRQVLEWLSPLTSRDRHQAVRDGRADGIGDWLLNTESFSEWSAAEDGAAKPVLLCYGDPGVGKTYISSLVIDTLSGGTGEGSAPVAYVYCDFTTQNSQSAKTVLASVLRQVVGSLTRIPDEVQKAFQHAKAQVDGCGLRLPEILEMLVASLSHLQKAFICIDALDEFPLKHRAELWHSLQRVVGGCPNSRLFLTGRPQIATEMRNYFPQLANMVVVQPDLDDIGRYIEKRLKEDLDRNAMNEELRAEIFRVIPQAISGIFLLVSINLDAILAEATIRQRRQALHRMTKGLGLQDAYNTTLNRIKQQGGGKSKLGVEALMWIAHCKRPLTSEELCHALGVELGEEDLDMDNVPTIQTVLSHTLGLVTFDKKASTVRLLHLTLQDYLREHPILFVTAHSMMAEICLTYLNTRAVRALPPNPSRDWLAPPFLEYATCFWGSHAAMGVTKLVVDLALRLLEAYENHVSATILGKKKISKCSRGFRAKRISGLHCIAFWGIAEIASSMLEVKRWDMNERDSKGCTPLMWAAKYENERVAELFLEQGDVEPDKVNQTGRTALSFAAESGSERLVKLLLGRGDVNPDSSDYYGRTPLSWATQWGNKAVVELLLEYDEVNPNSVDKNGLTPLLYAVDAGRCWGGECEGYDVVKLLLECGDVDPNCSDKDGRTPLSFAAEYGHERVVKMLLEHGEVNPNSPGINGRTPLSYASLSGLACVVKLFLDRTDVNPNSQDSNGRTPLSLAAKIGAQSVVKILLERGDVDPNLPDSNGRTPLFLAAWLGEEGVVKLLLERADVNPDLPDKIGLTTLSIATIWRHESIVKLLLEGGHAHPN